MHILRSKKIKQEREKEKKQKKLSKFKKQEIKKLKAKRKEKTKEKGINKKMTSVRKFADKNRMKKGIEIEWCDMNLNICNELKVK